MQMDNAEMNSQMAKRAAWQMINYRLKEQMPGDAFKEWEAFFNLKEITEECVTLTYNGEIKSLENWKGNYYSLCSQAITWVLERNVRVDIVCSEKRVKTKRSKTGSSDLEKKDKRHSSVFLRIIWASLLAGIVVVAGALVVNSIKNRNFRETFYQVESGKVESRIRILQLSDLHNVEYGDGNEQLVKRIKELKPDIIVMTGDMIDRREDSSGVVIELCRNLAEIAPSYFIYGNSETSKVYNVENMTQENIDKLLGNTADNRDISGFEKIDDDFKVLLEAAGVTVLQNSQASVQVGETTVDIYGILTSNPGAFWNYAGKTFGDFLNTKPANLKLLLCHEPLLFEFYDKESWGDLALCGHTHGGVVQLPYIGALYRNKDKGVLFPELQKETYYIDGRYDLKDTVLIVNTGLTNKGFVRINNQPELVVVDINRY